MYSNIIYVLDVTGVYLTPGSWFVGVYCSHLFMLEIFPHWKTVGRILNFGCLAFIAHKWGATPATAAYYRS